MATEDNALYGNDFFLLSLKGPITVHFMDGHTLDGIVTAQDTFNIFLTIEGEPFMIPRSQIRYIKGQPGQPIEKDASSVAFLKAESVRQDTLETRMPWPAEIEDADATEVLEADNEADESGTFILDTGGDGFAPAEGIGVSVAESAPPDDTDLTFVLEETPDLPEGMDAAFEALPDLEDATFVVEPPAPKVVAQLVCTGGPHAGEVFELKAGVTTLGRATDNNVSLSLDKEISRRHAVIMHEAGRFVLQDQNSLNGTFVNDNRLESPRYLEDGDVILVGVSYLEYQEKK